MRLKTRTNNKRVRTFLYLFGRLGTSEQPFALSTTIKADFNFKDLEKLKEHVGLSREQIRANC